MKLEIDISDDYSSLIKLSRLPPSRVANRSWRLANHQIIKSQPNDGYDSFFHDLKSAVSIKHQFPLVSNSTANTLMSKASKLSLYTPSDDEDLTNCKYPTKTKLDNNQPPHNSYHTHNHNSNNNNHNNHNNTNVKLKDTLSTIEDNEDDKKLFYFGNTPSPNDVTKNASDSDLTYSTLHQHNKTFDSHTDKPTIQRQDSLFSHFNLQRATNHNEYISEASEESEIEESDDDDESEIDESDIDESDIDDSDPEGQGHDYGVHREEARDKLSPIINSNLHSGHSQINYNTQNSHNILNPQLTAHSNHTMNSNNSNDRKMNQSISSIKRSDESEWLSVSSEEEETQPINFTKRSTTSELSSSQPRSLLSGLFLNEMKGHVSSHINKKHYPHGESLDGEELNQDGIPKLKRSSTTGVITIGENKDKIKIQRPSIMFQKRFTLMTDIKLPINEGEEADFQQNHQSKDNNNNNNDDDWKQKSIVGLSDYNASFKNHETTNVSQSLSKYQTKSLLNLTNFFKKNGSTERLKPSRTPSHEKSSTDRPSSTKQLSNDTIIKLSRPSSTNPDSINEIDEKLEVPKLITRDERNVKDDNKNKHKDTFSKSLKESLSIDNKLGKVPLPSRVFANAVNFTIEDDIDDYHSKGW